MEGSENNGTRDRTRGNSRADSVRRSSQLEPGRSDLSSIFLRRAGSPAAWTIWTAQPHAPSHPHAFRLLVDVAGRQKL
ncbi:hypothetical protein DB347_08905 [Opitutaceae bacterium EW11]|nr:hypothetical protein DB347_08905 [Opitutaceae bacterium EW11]